MDRAFEGVSGGKEMPEGSEVLDTDRFHVLSSSAVDFAVFSEGLKGGYCPAFFEDGDDVVVRVEEEAG